MLLIVVAVVGLALQVLLQLLIVVCCSLGDWFVTLLSLILQNTDCRLAIVLS
jgi:hypothetical protein